MASPRLAKMTHDLQLGTLLVLRAGEVVEVVREEGASVFVRCAKAGGEVLVMREWLTWPESCGPSPPAVEC